MPWALLLSGAEQRAQLSSSAGVQMRGGQLSHSEFAEMHHRSLFNHSVLPGWRAEAPHSFPASAGCGVWEAQPVLRLVRGSHTLGSTGDFFLAVHPFSRHRNKPTTSTAPMCGAQGRVTSHHPAERCCRAPSLNEVPVPSLQWGKPWSAADIPRERQHSPHRSCFCRTHQG